MTARQLARIAIALGVILVLWGLVELFGGNSGGLETARLIPAVAPTDVDTIEVASPEDTTRLVRASAAEWTVNGYAAAPDAVADLFLALADSQPADLIAQSPTSHARMGVDSASGKRLRIMHGDRTVADLVFGKSGRAFQTIYIRPTGDERVYLLRGRLGEFVRRSVSDWRDKRIVQVEPDSVARITVAQGQRRYALERGDSAWTFADGGTTDSTSIRRMLDGYRSLTAQGMSFATDAQADSADFARPDRRVTLQNAHGDTLTALLFDSTESGFWVRHASGATVYHLFRWKVNDITPADSAILQKGQEGREGQ